MSFQLRVFNPSDYPRRGHVATPWQSVYELTKIPAEELIIRDRDGNSLPFQVDPVDPDDPSRTTLLFSLVEPIAPGSEHYYYHSDFVTLEQGEPPLAQDEQDHPSYEIIHGPGKLARGVRLVNEKLIIWFNLIPAPEDDERVWFSGSATSIQLERYEMLDAIRAAIPEMFQFGHDTEKRGLQIDQLQLLRPPWEKDLYQQVRLFDRPYWLISASRGPVRASITIASEPFDYSYSCPFTHRDYNLTCQLYRVISLYKGVGYLIEELFVKGVRKESISQEIFNLFFVARYFTHMNLGPDPQVYQFAGRPDWFAIGANYLTFPGYGFSTDVHARPLAYPHQDPNYPNRPNEHCCFSWELYPCQAAKCLHLYLRGQPDVFDSLSGRHWFELIYKPLKAVI